MWSVQLPDDTFRIQGERSRLQINGRRRRWRRFPGLHVQAAVVRWQTQEGDREGKTLQCETWPLDVAVPSSRPPKYCTLNLQAESGFIAFLCIPYLQLDRVNPFLLLPLLLLASPLPTLSARAVVSELFCLRERNANTYRQGHLATAAILWIYCITWHCFQNCDGPIISLFTKWTDKGRWLCACPGSAGCTSWVQHLQYLAV